MAEIRHFDSKLNCYELLKVLQELVEKDGLCLSDIAIGVSIDNCRCYGNATGLKLFNFGDGYLLVFCSQE